MLKVKDVTVLKELEPHFTPNGTKQRIVLCKCFCGNIFKTQLNHLKNGHTKSCGCYNKKRSTDVNTKHGLEGTRIYNTYYNMRSRCYNPNNKEYKHYGKRGITVCEEWLNDFMAFYDWSIKHGYSESLSIDRIDNNKGYDPTNCRWVDMKTQQRNKSNNRIITIDNETHCLSEWCDILGLKRDTVYKRLNHGWTIEKALNYGKVSD